MYLAALQAFTDEQSAMLADLPSVEDGNFTQTEAGQAADAAFDSMDTDEGRILHPGTPAYQKSASVRMSYTALGTWHHRTSLFMRLRRLSLILGPLCIMQAQSAFSPQDAFGVSISKPFWRMSHSKPVGHAGFGGCCHAWSRLWCAYEGNVIGLYSLIHVCKSEKSE